MKFSLVLVVFLMRFGDHVSSQKTVLDLKFAPFLRFGRETFGMLIQPKAFDRILALNIKNKKVQQQFPNDMRFFCDVNGAGARSKVVPKSVHKLRPGDIDIVGAIGDSLTAANGAFALDATQVLLEGRGVSWSIGGHQTWRNFLTLPNILKEFNPNLYGYPDAVYSSSYQKSSRFNVAEAGVGWELCESQTWL